MTPRKLFGTDGIRGNASTELEPGLVSAIGRAVAVAARDGVISRSKRPRIVLGRDTRVSGPAVQQAFIDGATSAGADVSTGGILPTAAVAYLTSLLGFDAGVVVSASHNPASDNGIKLFGPGGWKLAPDQERAIEELVAQGEHGDSDEPGECSELPDASVAYVTHLCAMASQNLRGMRVVADCANGAASAIVPKTFDRLGLEAVILNANLDGAKINASCGALHPEVISEAAAEQGAVGLTFDGDADRVLLSDEHGRVIDGDAILAILAARLRSEGALSGDGVVATVMANQALRRWCHNEGIDLHEVAVGDRYVLEGMKKAGLVLGGEQSGHIVRLDRTTTGDGILVAIAVLDAVAASGGTLADLVPFEPFPQVLINVETARRDEAETNDAVTAACEAAQRRLGDDGRVLVRPSGTEPLVRVMVEATDIELATEVATDIAKIVEAELGGSGDHPREEGT